MEGTFTQVVLDCYPVQVLFVAETPERIADAVANRTEQHWLNTHPLRDGGYVVLVDQRGDTIRVDAELIGVIGGRRTRAEVDEYLQPQF